jgi:hypothetical protein
MTDPDTTAELEQLVRDERALRRAAETRIATLSDQVETWRSRADERAERIERLLAAQDAPAVRRWLGRIRAVWRTESDSDTETPARPTGHRVPPRVPTLRIAAAVTSPGVANVLATTDVVGIDAAELSEADLVVVEPAAFASLQDGAREELERWATMPARRPLVVAAETPGPLAHMLGDRDLVIPVKGTLDPATHRPGPPTPHRTEGTITRDGATIHMGPVGPALVTGAGSLLADPPLWLIELAASGVAVTGGHDADPAEIPALAVAARRWAWRHHTPWRRIADLADRLGLDVPDPTPRVAGILVSNRTDEVPGAIEGFLRQTHPSTELVVGLHGVGMTADIEEVTADSPIPLRLLTFDGSMPLGACLNRAIEATSAPLLAKIDDDDHYGPAHVEDAVHALAYSGAGIVGKAAQFTYVASADRTVVRRHRTEEVFVDGALTGATLVFRRSVWEQAPFPHRPRRVDVLFERAARVAGTGVYANSRWEFCYVRGPQNHTWSTDDDAFLAGTVPAWDGYHPRRTEVADVATTA